MTNTILAALALLGATLAAAVWYDPGAARWCGVRLIARARALSLARRVYAREFYRAIKQMEATDERPVAVQEAVNKIPRFMRPEVEWIGGCTWCKDCLILHLSEDEK